MTCSGNPAKVTSASAISRAMSISAKRCNARRRRWTHACDGEFRQTHDASLTRVHKV